MKRSLFLVLLSPLALSAGETVSPVQIQLRAQSMARSETVTVGDVAELTGGTAVLRERIKRIDLADAPKVAETVRISASQIVFRLQLTDLPNTSFQVFGMKEVVVVPFVDTLSEERVIQQARELILKSHSWPEEDLMVRLARPLTVQLPKISDKEKLDIKTELHTPVTELGRCQVNVAIVIDGEKRLQFPLYFETKLMRAVPVCTVALARGDQFTDQNVRFEKRPVEASARPAPTLEGLVGKVAKRAMPAGQVVNATDTDGESATPEGGPVIKARQVVKMLVPLGSLNVVARGEAMQDGKMGQVIRVQNVDSKKVVTGRVTGPDTVEINPGGTP